MRASHPKGLLSAYMNHTRILPLTLALLPLWVSAQEICNNAIDDDTDGLIDLNDPDCPCATAVFGEGTPSYIRNHSFEEQMCCPFGFVSMVSPPWLSCASGWQQATNATSDYFHECGYSPEGFNLPPPDGDGAVGFFAFPGYFEYVGTCLTYPLPANPLLAGVTYTISMWISTAAVNDVHSQTLAQADPSYFTDQLPLAIFGHANACVQFPIGTMDCIGFDPAWTELGRVMVQPAWDWSRVSITFTPTEDMHSIMIGGGCDTPASFVGRSITNAAGDTYFATPYFVVDELMLTVAGDQALLPVMASGSMCAGTAATVGVPPPGATNLQWYRNGVAVVGQTSPNLNVSALGLDGGTYTLASSLNGECLMGASYIPPPIPPTPRPALVPATGCAPLTVAFADTTGAGVTTLSWDVGVGPAGNDSAFVHTYSTPGTYDVTLRVQDGAGCIGETMLEDAVVVFPAVSGQVTATPDPAMIEDPVVTLTGTGTGDVVNWWWDLGVAEPSSSTDPSLSVTFPAVEGEYPVFLVVSNANGCVDTVRSVVRVIASGAIEMPNVFSPNGDARNDRFLPMKPDGTTALLEIYNRWGQQVFSTRSLEQGWTGGDAPDGTYYYIVTPDDTRIGTITGHVTLVR
ncbi:MAG: gliding motility-associated C-terminal domain-containing protein [Flavobacteriales bacterium]|nr:gliding motility-associated C-terminal domain-containing protein [Flavobacteriales bacterium]